MSATTRRQRNRCGMAAVFERRIRRRASVGGGRVAVELKGLDQPGAVRGKAQAGSVLAASPVNRAAWQRQPPKSVCRQSQLATRLGHPGRAAKVVERRRLPPNPAERMLADIVEPQRLDAWRSWAGENVSLRIHREIAAPPAFHAGLGSIGQAHRGARNRCAIVPRSRVRVGHAGGRRGRFAMLGKSASRFRWAHP